MTAVFRQVYPESRFDFSSPNHILGMSYAKENATYPTPMTLYPIARKQAGFHDATISGKLLAPRRLGKVFSTRNNASAANGAFYNRTTFTNTDNDFMGKLLALPKV